MKKIAFDSYIIDTLMRDLVNHEKKPSSFVIILYFWARTSGMRRRSLTMSLQEIADDTGLSKSAVQAALNLLKRRRLIQSERDSATSKPTYYVLSPWRRARSRQAPARRLSK